MTISLFLSSSFSLFLILISTGRSYFRVPSHRYPSSPTTFLANARKSFAFSRSFSHVKLPAHFSFYLPPKWRYYGGFFYSRITWKYNYCFTNIKIYEIFSKSIDSFNIHMYQELENKRNIIYMRIRLQLTFKTK